MTDSIQTEWVWLLYEHDNDNVIRQLTITPYEPDLTSFPSDVTYVEITQELHDSMHEYLRYRYNSDGTVTEVDHNNYMSQYQRWNRKQRLEETDIYALGDRAISDEMRAYRQALRDVPQQEGFPDNVVWPTKPE